MKRLCITLGAIVLLLLLASSGSINGDLCLSTIGCVDAGADGLRIHGNTP